MKTADEIKKALECCATAACESCPYKDCESYDECTSFMAADALALFQQLEADKIILLEESHEIRKDMLGKIQQLEADNAQQARCIENMTDMLNAAHDEAAKLQAERDAIMLDMRKSCVTCKHSSLNNPGIYCCPYVEDCHDEAKWQWRGVQKEDAHG